MNRPAWKYCACFEPRNISFGEDKIIESEVISHIVGFLNSLAKQNRRGSNSKTKDISDYGFRESECLAAINIAGIRDVQATYLDNLIRVIELYPFMLINSSIDIESLKNRELHKYLLAKNYILPVLGYIPTDDPFVTRVYDQDFYGLISGEELSLSVKSSHWFENFLRFEDMQHRYQGIERENEKLLYTPKIYWLGVDDNALQEALTFLYNNSINKFTSEEIIQQFSVDKDLFEAYVKNSMLFAKGNKKGEKRWRLHRRLIFPSLMQDMVNRYETALLECGAIDTTYHGDISSKNTYEYHRIGMLFDNPGKASYALSLLAYVRQYFSGIDYDVIAVVDNGWEKSLIDLIPKVFGVERVIRIVNYYGKPLLSPYDILRGDEKCIVLSDVVNTGKFLQSTLKLICSNTKEKPKGVYAFIANANFDSTRLFMDELIDTSGRFGYYLRKEIREVHEANLTEHNKRFSSPSPEAFVLFWHTIEQIGLSERGKKKRIANLKTSEGQRVHANVWLTSELHLQNIHGALKLDDSPFIQFLKREITSKSIDTVVISVNNNFNGLVSILKRVNPVIKIASYEPETKKISNLDDSKNVAFLCMWIDCMDVLHEIVQKIQQKYSDSISIHILSGFTFKNVLKSSHDFASECLSQLESQTSSIAAFYDSSLPYYLLKINEPALSHFEKNLDLITLGTERDI